MLIAKLGSGWLTVFVYASVFVLVTCTAVVRILEKNPKTGEPQLRTATIMRKGFSFGVCMIQYRFQEVAVFSFVRPLLCNKMQCVRQTIILRNKKYSLILDNASDNNNRKTTCRMASKMMIIIIKLCCC